MSKPRAADGIDLKWVDGITPSVLPNGTAFGSPWAQGEVDRTTAFQATSGGKAVPLQSWPLAYWPDGSLKWAGHALPANAALGTSIHVGLGSAVAPTSPVSVAETTTVITVTTGSFVARFNKTGTTLIDSLSLSGKNLATNGVIVLHLQGAPDEPELAGSKPAVTVLQGKVGSVVVEQRGPVRAVIKVTGVHTGGGHNDFLPFITRFYVSAGATSLRTVHFFMYDGDQNKDFIKGIGIRFSTPLTDELYDRHIRFLSHPSSSSTPTPGIWGEPVLILSGLRRDATAPVLSAQFQGLPTPAVSTWPTTVSGGIKQLAVWNDYWLEQRSSKEFRIGKRSLGGKGGKASWLWNAGFGERASGVGYVGGAKAGGVAFGMRDFWQGAPRALDIQDAATSQATVTLWAYSPRSQAMDMRHYDTVAHGLDLSYEDVGNPDPNPVGVGRSFEVTIQLVSATPSRDMLAQLASTHIRQPQLVAAPSFYAAHRLFGGRWNVPDTSTTGSAALEKRKSDLLDFYLKEIEQRQFYGFWDYGDVMHTYDQTRHTWRYDVGGYAWDNGELGTDLWLWMSFLRTGRADIFRTACAMTRHISEVDSHNIGTFAGLGSRHNVSHWGDGAKEARVSGSTLRRPFYYLTTDELMGDLMDYTLQADQTIMTWEPLRKVLPPPPPEGPGRLRIGPDWTTLAGNWFTKWERTGDTKWRDRIKVGMHDIGGFKYGLFTGNGAAVGWNAATGHLVDEGGEGSGSYHLTMLFGGGEFLMEVMEIITDEPAFDAAWLDFCRLYNASDSEKTARYGKAFSSGGFQNLYAKLQAYAGQRSNNNSLKQAAWNFINSATPQSVVAVGGSDVLNPINEIPNLNTNDAASVSLSEYAVLAIAPELAPRLTGSRAAQSTWEEGGREGESAVEDADEIKTVGSTVCAYAKEDGEHEPRDNGRNKASQHENRSESEVGKKIWRRLLCLD